MTDGLKAQTLEPDGQVPSTPLPSFPYLCCPFICLPYPLTPHIVGKVLLWGTVLGGDPAPPPATHLLSNPPTDFTSEVQLKSLPDCMRFPSLTPVPFPWPVHPRSLWPLLPSTRFWACVTPALPHICALLPQLDGPPWPAISGLVFYVAWSWPHPMCLRDVWKPGFLGPSLSQSGVPLSHLDENHLEKAV